MIAGTTLYGSQTSPYVRLCRLVRGLSGAEGHVAFSLANPMDEAHRSTNPLGKVPALILAGGTRLLETTLICRTLMAIGGTDLLPKEEGERIAAEADAALFMGVLDLGVAHRLESLRPQEVQSADWQARRVQGIEAAYPLIEEAAARASGAAEYVACALGATCDWLDFRLADVVDWRSACPKAAALTDQLIQRPDFAETDPRA